MHVEIAVLDIHPSKGKSYVMKNFYIHDGKKKAKMIVGRKIELLSKLR